jgi:hypothetical protein
MRRPLLGSPCSHSSDAESLVVKEKGSKWVRTFSETFSWKYRMDPSSSAMACFSRKRSRR